MPDTVRGIWDEERVRAETARFAARYLLVFRDPRFGPEVQESGFLRALAAGKAPAWLRLVTFNRDIYVYQVLRTPPPGPAPLPPAVERESYLGRECDVTPSHQRRWLRCGQIVLTAVR